MKSILVKSISVCAVFFFVYSCQSESGKKEDTGMQYLEFEDTRVGVLTEVGGRIVDFSIKGMENVLKSDSSLWNEPDSLRPTVSDDPVWKEYNGHTVWLGPQSEWWTHQDLNMSKREQKSVWPPDPWIIYAPYSILEKSASRILIEGPASPLSGIRLKKEILLKGRGELEIVVTGTNIRSENISWDLWMNTRVDGYSRIYVPVKNEKSIRIEANENRFTEPVDFALDRGYFSFVPSAPENGRVQRSSKAFLRPSMPFMAAFRDSICFIIAFDLYPYESTHPEQGMVEIYNRTTRESDEALTEMEYHGPYTTLAPGESVTVREAWQIIPFHGSEEDRIKFLEDYLLRNH